MSEFFTPGLDAGPPGAGAPVRANRGAVEGLSGPTVDGPGGGLLPRAAGQADGADDSTRPSEIMIVNGATRTRELDTRPLVIANKIK